MSMIVDEIRNVVLLLSNPSWQNVGTVPNTIVKNITDLSNFLSYSNRLSENITVLSSRYAKTTNGVIQGFLYIPTLHPHDPCVDESAPHVPLTAVRLPDLPPTNYRLIALSPWTSPECSQSYLKAAAKDPLHGFIFYLPGNTADHPPPSDAPEWDMNDKGKWKTQHHFPIYAISTTAGRNMMFNMSLYSGNLTEVPYGSNISDLYSIDSSDYVRMWTELQVSTHSDHAGLWVYVLVVIGVLLVVITLISFLMHAVQARRRASLRRRVRVGQVNLEGMGIKRLTVPLNHVKTFPLFTYHYEPSATSPPTSPRSSRPGRTRRGSRGTTVVRASTLSDKCLETVRSTSLPTAVATDHQPTCEICLQQYQNRVTVIRELPCGHIFHPECIDEFLHDVSSLCPLCKACMLPKGYCPKITNTMVRRERAIRRLRDQILVEDDDDSRKTRGDKRRIQSWGSTIKKQIFHLPTFASSTSAELQPRPQAAIAVDKDQSNGADQQPVMVAATQEMEDDDACTPINLARQRMRELAGSVPPDDGNPPFTRWQWIRTRVFPGF